MLQLNKRVKWNGILTHSEGGLQASSLEAKLQQGLRGMN